jgi:FkbM family methyltransferase
MRKSNSATINRDWHEISRSIRRVVRPTAMVDLLGTDFKLHSEARTSGAERDYAFLRELARGKHCIFDVGANVGLTALVMVGEMAPDGRLIAFETSEDGCRMIRDHAAFNGYGDRIHVVNALIAERSGLTIDFFGDSASGGSSIIPGYLGHQQPLSKATLALDDFIANTGFLPDLIKVDVEGAEARVLAGLGQTLTTTRPVLFVELHSWDGSSVPDMATKLLTQLNPVNYQMVYLRRKEVVEDPAMFEGRGRCHVLLCPNESPLLNDLSSLNTDDL